MEEVTITKWGLWGVCVVCALIGASIGSWIQERFGGGKEGDSDGK